MARHLIVDDDRLLALTEPIVRAERIWILSGETSRAGAHALHSGMTMIRPGVHLVEEHSSGRELSSAKAGDAADYSQTYLRIKPQFAPCGDGTDYYVDRSRRFWALDVSDDRTFDEAAPRSDANRPLRVDAAAARAPADPLPAGLPPRKKKRRRREL